MPVTSQLRIYSVLPGQMDAFVRVFSEQIVPLRVAVGFRVDGAWRDDDEGVFAWVVSYDGPDTWEAREAAYYGSPERAAMDPQPGVFLRGAQTRLMRPVAAD